MGKEVAGVSERTEQSHEYGLKKETLTIWCDDRSVYVFQKPQDEPSYKLIRRFKDDGTLSTSNGVLPSAVTETLNDLLGEKHWRK